VTILIIYRKVLLISLSWNKHKVVSYYVNVTVFILTIVALFHNVSLVSYWNIVSFDMPLLLGQISVD